MNDEIAYVQKVRQRWMVIFGVTEEKMNSFWEQIISTYVQATMTARLATSSERREPV